MSVLKIWFAIVIGAVVLGPSGCAPAIVQVDAIPRLVWVAPGIWVVEDQPYAQYYADGYYWRHVGGAWYRSTYYDDGFVFVDVGLVPRVVIGGYRPVHAHYRGPRNVQTRPIIRDHRAPRPRGHRR